MNVTSIPFRGSFRFVLFTGALVAVALPGWSADTPPASPDAGAFAVPIISTDEIVQKELRDLDKFFDINPQVEETLRSNLAQMEQADFRAKNPAWDQLLRKRPAAARALRAEKRFLLHRAIARLARTPLGRAEIVAFDAFLDKNPAIASELEKKPAQVRDPIYLAAHPALGDFLQKHPALSTLLLDPKGGKAPDAAPGKKKKN
jgi:hypothetical protein